jgi:hypothetical protein
LGCRQKEKTAQRPNLAVNSFNIRSGNRLGYPTYILSQITALVKGKIAKICRWHKKDRKGFPHGLNHYG